jgi:hypothetical protein
VRLWVGKLSEIAVGDTPEVTASSRGYAYDRIEDAHYARKVEIRSRKKGYSDHTIACSTVDDFVRLTV